MLNWLGLPVAASAHAAAVDEVMVLVHWLMLVLGVGWGRQPVALYHGVRARWSVWLEGGVLAAEVILLVFFSIPVWSARVDALPAPRESTIVRVVAERFAWNVHYPGADRVFGLTSGRRRAPVGRPLLRRLLEGGRDLCRCLAVDRDRL